MPVPKLIQGRNGPDGKGKGTEHKAATMPKRDK